MQTRQKFYREGDLVRVEGMQAYPLPAGLTEGANVRVLRKISRRSKCKTNSGVHLRCSSPISTPVGNTWRMESGPKNGEVQSVFRETNRPREEMPFRAWSRTL